MIPRGCVFKFTKTKSKNERVDVTFRSEEYFREYSPFVDTFDSPHLSRKALSAIDIFDVDYILTIKRINLNTSLISKEKTLSLEFSNPFTPKYLVYKLRIKVKKALTNDNVLIVKLSDCPNTKYFKIYENQSTHKFLPRSSTFSIDVLKNFKDDVEYILEIDWLNTVGDLFLKNHEAFFIGILMGQFKNFNSLLILPFFSEIPIILFGFLLGLGYPIKKTRREWSKRYIITLLLPYPLSYIPILYKLIIHKELSSIIIHIYDIVSIFCLIRDVLKTRIYLPTFNPLYNLPILFVLFKGFYYIQNFYIKTILANLLTIMFCYMQVHPVWVTSFVYFL